MPITIERVCDAMDWIPGVATLSNIVHLFARCAPNIARGSTYHDYLSHRTIGTHVAHLIPGVNIVVQVTRLCLNSDHAQETAPLIAAFRPYEQKRRFPSVDELHFKDYRRSKTHRYGQQVLFSDHEIVSKKLIIREDPSTKTRFTEHGKAIVWQKDINLSKLACVSMLCQDHAKTVFNSPTPRSFVEDYKIPEELHKAGLTARVSDFTVSSLNSKEYFLRLKNKLLEHGSAIVPLQSKAIGDHYMIVDEVVLEQSSMRIRDPYHGWEITVKIDHPGIVLSGPIIQVVSSTV